MAASRVGTTLLPSRARAPAASSDSSDRASAISSGGTSSSRAMAWAERIAWRATSGCSSSMRRLKQIEEVFRDDTQETRGLGAIPLALRAVTAGHGLENQAGGVQVLGRARRREECRRPGANREAFDVADLFELAKRIDASLRVTDRATPRCARRCRDRAASGRRDRRCPVASRRQQRQRPAPYLGVGMRRAELRSDGCHRLLC